MSILKHKNVRAILAVVQGVRRRFAAREGVWGLRCSPSWSRWFSNDRRAMDRAQRF